MRRIEDDRVIERLKAAATRIEGEQDGCVYLTSPIELLGSLLAVNGESEVSERTLRDMCRELTNVISGNASRAFGGAWKISVPLSLGPTEIGQLALPASSFVMPIRWRGATALLVIGLEASGVS